jgi:PAS domain S-box-containing protein|tara:strand:- start:260 stop:2449 length:2190 start_codon:yes stop_codon:yes gene_type:complete
MGRSGKIWLAILFVSLVAAVLLMADVTQNGSYFGRLHNWLLPINSALLLLFIALIGYNANQLKRQLKRKEPGSRLTLRLVWSFVVIASMPVLIVYTFSIWLVEEGVDSWFDVKVEKALQDAVSLSRSSLDLHIRNLSQQAEPLSKKFEGNDSFNATLTINELLSSSNADEIVLFDSNNRIIASGSSEPNTDLPALLDESIFQRLSSGENYVAMEPISDGGLQIRLVFSMPPELNATESQYLQFIYPIPDRISELTNNVQTAFGQYNELIYLRGPLKQNFILILTLVLALGILFAVFTAFYFSRVLVSPVRELVEGTKAVAAGQYHKKISVRQSDDLGMLVASFNRMTERLSVARDTTAINQRIIENQRLYLQKILEHLSSGVMSLDESLQIKTANATTSQILGVNITEFINKPLMDVGAGHDSLKTFTLSVVTQLRQTSEEWQKELEIFTSEGRKTILCKSVTLLGEDASKRGYVLVFDDITTLLQAQRDSAWGEVARRLAHEIKNPLTPIQLSAERLRRKLMPVLEPEQASLVDKATHTIVQQVESMGLMVDDFSAYARMPVIDSKPLDINDLIRNVAELYKGNTENVRLDLSLNSETLFVRGDSGRLRQVLHNLIKNSMEATATEKYCQVQISAAAQLYLNKLYITIEVLDNGQGFSAEILNQAFDPYMTTKQKGNGLGLAIVKKIIEEHNGIIQVSNRTCGGAMILIRLPSYNSSAEVIDRSVGGR